jgi:hypothetical protein
VNLFLVLESIKILSRILYSSSISGTAILKDFDTESSFRKDPAFLGGRSSR